MSDLLDLTSPSNTYEFLLSLWYRTTSTLTLTFLAFPKDLVNIISKYSKNVIHFDIYDKKCNFIQITNTKTSTAITNTSEYGMMCAICSKNISTYI